MCLNSSPAVCEHARVTCDISPGYETKSASRPAMTLLHDTSKERL